MIENTNKAIAINSIILYVKMVLNTIFSILTTRFALHALGVVDFGLFSVLGGIITFVSIFNTIMLTTSNRFIAVAIGKGDIIEANKQFNVNLVIHFIIALCTFFVAFPVGDWYILHFINYDGDINDALVVFNITIAASIISFIGVPYNGLLIAKERFLVFSSMEVLAHFGRMLVAYLLIYFFTEKLLIYTVTMAFFSIMPMLVYILYCKVHFSSIVKLQFVRNRQMYKDVTRFSLWVSVGAFSTICRNQGAALLVNAFFNTVLNTALGIANSICGYLNLFAQNITQPMAPQITKSYTSGDMERSGELLLMSTKYSFLLYYIAAFPFLIAPEWLLNIWLGQVPPYAKMFLVLLIVDGLVCSLNSGISNIIFASGKIKSYQIITSSLNILAITIGFVVLFVGSPAYSLLYVYIIISFVRVVSVQIILHRTLDFDNWVLIKKSYIPCVKVFLLSLPLYGLVLLNISRILLLLLSFSGLCIIVFYVGLSQQERTMVMNKLKSLK